jgi:hypothetical protein
VQYVGQITGLVDCLFKNTPEGRGQRSQIIRENYQIRLGQTLALASGLIEITYLSGAKVILQGPVTYKVESKAGGYLSLGKLTARVDNPKSQIPNPKSQIRNKSEIRNQKSEIS